MNARVIPRKMRPLVDEPFHGDEARNSVNIFSLGLETVIVSEWEGPGARFMAIAASVMIAAREFVRRRGWNGIGRSVLSESAKKRKAAWQSHRWQKLVLYPLLVTWQEFPVVCM